MTDKTPPFVGVRRFTTEYVIPEDRIRIALERQDDTLVVLWLTRRLMVRLVPQILKVLETLPKPMPSKKFLGSMLISFP